MRHVRVTSQLVIPRAGGGTSTPRLHGSIITASGILDRPVKPGDDSGAVVASSVAAPHAAFAFASRIARHTRSGVSGMSIWVMP